MQTEVESGNRLCVYEGVGSSDFIATASALRAFPRQKLHTKLSSRRSKERRIFRFLVPNLTGRREERFPSTDCTRVYNTMVRRILLREATNSSQNLRTTFGRFHLLGYTRNRALSIDWIRKQGVYRMAGDRILEFDNGIGQCPSSCRSKKVNHRIRSSSNHKSRTAVV